jgi:hypothetical protein
MGHRPLAPPAGAPPRLIEVEDLEGTGDQSVVLRPSAETGALARHHLDLECRRDVVDDPLHRPGKPEPERVHAGIEMQLGDSENETVAALPERQRAPE